MNDLKVTLIQSNLFWENKEKNLDQFSRKIDAITEPTDLIILPEMFSTGFSMNPKKLSEGMNGETVSWMKERARAKKCVVAGSFICEESGNFYNRLLWVNPDGSYSKYDKRHLFSMGDEHNHYAAGEEKLIVKIKDWKICPLICYDLRFPVWARNTHESFYDVLIYVANWPERRSHPWKTLLLARAIENQAYVIGVNRIGADGNAITHSGDSAVINPKGEIISTTKANEEATETVALSYTELAEFRKQFPVMQDADKFELKSMVSKTSVA